MHQWVLLRSGTVEKLEAAPPIVQDGSALAPMQEKWDNVPLYRVTPRAVIEVFKLRRDCGKFAASTMENHQTTLNQRYMAYQGKLDDIGAIWLRHFPQVHQFMLKERRINDTKR